MDAETLKGSWKAAIPAWGKADPAVGELGKMAEMMFGKVNVTMDGESLVIAGYGAGQDKSYTYAVRGVEGSTATVDVKRADGGAGVYEITFVDADHIVMRLTEPAKDVMALQRA